MPIPEEASYGPPSRVPVASLVGASAAVLWLAWCLRFFDVGYASAIAYTLLALVMVVVTILFKRIRTIYA